MSSLPPTDPQEAFDDDNDDFLNNPNIIDPTADDDGDESWSSLYQRLLLQPSSAAPVPNFLQDYSQIIADGDYNDHELICASSPHHCGSVIEPQNLVTPQEGGKAGNNGSKLKRRKNSSSIRRKISATNIDSGDIEEEEEEDDDDNEGKVAKRKMDHNERERVRRMKLNASYLALRALLPPPTDHSRRRSKKRWSAPAILERALNYIPELQNEVEALDLQKRSLQQQYSMGADKKEINSPNNNHKTNNHSDDENGKGRRPTFSVNKISSEETMIQIMFMSDEGLMKKFIHLMENVESELICLIKSASTVHACSHENNTRIICCHLHVFQTNQGSSSNADSIEQVISRLQS